MEMLLPLTIKIIEDKKSKDAPFIAYSPEFDVSSCGPTEEKARQNLHEAITIFVEEVEKKGKLKEILEELGFQKKRKGWKVPRVSFEPFSFHFS